MTTYTLTQAQFEVLDKTWDKCEIAHILRSLKPNSQEPVGWMIASDEDLFLTNDERLAFSYEESERQLVYTHPAPISKEDMVKVLEAVKCLIATNWPLEEAASSDGCYTDDPNEIKAREAITIMQSAIERIK